MVTDEQLVERALGGTASAYAELVSRYQERLLRFLLTRTGSRADAEDALQDTFMSAYRYLHTFNARWRFSTWIYRIAIRQAYRQARRLSPGAEGAEEGNRLEAICIDEVGDDSQDPLRQCIELSDRENVWLTAKRLLSDEVFAAMWLRYVEDMPVKEIARSLDKSSSWAKVNLLRARRRLSAALSESAIAAERRESYG